MKRRLALVTMVILASGSALCLQGTAQEKAKGENPNGDKPAAKAKSATPAPVVLTRCRIKLINKVILASGRTGILAFVEPKEGDKVVKDQQVAGLVDDVPRAAYNVAEKEASNDVEVRYAIKAAEVADAEHEAAMEGNRKLPGTVPLIEVKKLKLAGERGSLQIEQAEHQFEVVKLKRDEAREALKSFKIEAPFDGVVTRVYKAKGEAVREGDPILELSATERVRVEGYVNVKDGWSIAQGAPVQVQLDIPEADLAVEKELFQGNITFVDVEVQAVTQELRLWAEVVNRDNMLRAGLSAKMTIHPAATKTAQNGTARSK